MPFTEPTPAVARAVESAGRQAAGRGQAAAGPRDLLLALLDDEEGRPAVILDRHGLDVTAWSGRRPDAASGADAPVAPLSPAAERLCRQAQRLARATTEDGVCTTDQLLLAILDTDADLRADL